MKRARQIKNAQAVYRETNSSECLSIARNDFLVYLASEKGLSPHTIEAYGRDLADFAHFLFFSAAQDVYPCRKEEWKGVDLQQLIAFLKHKTDRGYASSSICRAVIAIKVFFRFLKREGMVAVNHLALVETPKLWQLVPDVLAEEEISQLLSLPKRDSLKGARDLAILETLYACGLRVSELCALQLQDVDDTTIRIQGKGGKERLVPIGQEAIRAIDHYLSFREGEETALFLSLKGKPLDRIHVWKLIKTYALKGGLEKRVSPHTFRHTYATHLLEHGADLRIIQELLGHADIASTDRYTRVSSAHLQEAFHAFHPRP